MYIYETVYDVRSYVYIYIDVHIYARLCTGPFGPFSSRAPMPRQNFNFRWAFYRDGNVSLFVRPFIIRSRLPLPSPHSAEQMDRGKSVCRSLERDSKRKGKEGIIPRMIGWLNFPSFHARENSLHGDELGNLRGFRIIEWNIEQIYIIQLEITVCVIRYDASRPFWAYVCSMLLRWLHLLMICDMISNLQIYW